MSSAEPADASPQRPGTDGLAERLRDEETLRKFSRVLEQTGDSVFITNRDGVIEYVNPSFEQLTGYTRDEAVGATPRLFKSDHHDHRFFADLWRRLLAGDTVRVVFSNRRKDGRVYNEDQTVTPLRNATGEITHFVSTGRDVTDRRRAEEALRRLNDRLEHEAARIAGVLHDEAGQFLTVAHLRLQAVARNMPAADRERLLEVQHQLDLVEEQLRRLSHELRPRILDDLGLVEALTFLANGVSSRSGVQVEVDAVLARACPPLVATAVYRMVQEGLTNMMRHARARHGRVKVRAGAADLTCVVEDDGVGFEPTVRLAGAGGLGLAGIRDRLEALGATFAVSSWPGSGTRLQTTIPLETIDAAADPPGR